MNWMSKSKNKLVEELKIELKGLIPEDMIQSNLKKANDKFGDLTFPCHTLAKEYDLPPSSIAEELEHKLESKEIPGISKVTSENGFLNFKYNPEQFTEEVLTEVLFKENNYGSNQIGKGKKIVIDHSGPNLGKPLHVGHIRSTIIGDSVANILRLSGYDVHEINYLGDIGSHIGKLIKAYEMWGDEAKLKQNPMGEMLNLYVRFHQESEKNPVLKKQADEILQSLESNEYTHSIFLNKIRDYSILAFNQVYDLLDVSFDETTGQSAFSEKGKQIVKEAVKKGLASELEGEEGQEPGILMNLEEYDLPPKMLLKTGGTAIYSTQDIASAVERKKVHNPDKIIYVVATEQTTYFKQLFKILDVLGYDLGKTCHHLEFGLMSSKEKKMSTREGNVIHLEEVLNGAINSAKDLVSDDLSLEYMEEVAQNLGVGSVKYDVLSRAPIKGIIFSEEQMKDVKNKKSLYIQYTFARASRIIENVVMGKKYLYYFEPSQLQDPTEQSLIKKISEFPGVVERAANQLKPNLVANYAYELAQDFNTFYESNKITSSEQEASRISLVSATNRVLTKSLNLLGIKHPYKI